MILAFLNRSTPQLCRRCSHVRLYEGDGCSDIRALDKVNPYDIGSPEFFATDSLTLSRSRINSCQSAPAAAPSPLTARGNIGGDNVIVTSEGRGSHAPSGKIFRVPRSDTGIIGTPVSTAALKAPNWNCRTPGSRVNVPSGKTKTDSPLRRKSSISAA